MLRQTEEFMFVIGKLNEIWLSIEFVFFKINVSMDICGYDILQGKILAKHAVDGILDVVM